MGRIEGLKFGQKQLTEVKGTWPKIKTFNQSFLQDRVSSFYLELEQKNALGMN
jgi:hypothetical protein